MAEIGKAVGQWIIANVGWSVIIALFILSCVFKITKVELDPLGWIVSWFGKMFTKDVRNDISTFKTETNTRIDGLNSKIIELKEDSNKRVADLRSDLDNKIMDLKEDSNRRVADLRLDLDEFEERTNNSICDIQTGTNSNCKILKKELDAMKKSNDMQTVRQIKAHVLDFANSCMNKRKHTKKEFDNIIDENALYEELVKKYRLKNNVYKEDYEFIMKIYHECQEKNSFLNEKSTNE